MLSGGDSSATGGVTAVNQTVDVSASTATIDAGRSTANLSAYLGGAREYEDTMTVRAEFLNGTASLGSFQIGPVTAADRNRQTTLLRRAAAQAVPAGTRQIKVSVISNDADKQRSSALADNVKLTLSTGTGTVRQGETENPPPGDRFGAKTLVTLKPSTRVKPRKALRVVVRNGNGFAVTGRLGTRRLNVGARSTSTLKVKLSAKQRRALQRKRSAVVRLSAVVTDPAGESRKVTKRVRLRIKR